MQKFLGNFTPDFRFKKFQRSIDSMNFLEFFVFIEREFISEWEKENITEGEAEKKNEKQIEFARDANFSISH